MELLQICPHCQGSLVEAVEKKIAEQRRDQHRTQRIRSVAEGRLRQVENRSLILRFPLTSLLLLILFAFFVEGMCVYFLRHASDEVYVFFLAVAVPTLIIVVGAILFFRLRKKIYAGFKRDYPSEADVLGFI